MIKQTFRLSAILFLAALHTFAFAQQSNKSKSKDRYREKELPAKSELVRNAEQNAGWARVAATELRSATLALSAAAAQNGISQADESRVLGYALLAAYQTASRYEPKGYPTLQGTVNGLPALYSFTPADSVYYPLAALYALLETGKGLLSTNQILLEKQVAIEQGFRAQRLPEILLAGSKSAGIAMANAILSYSMADGYQRLALANPGRAEQPYWAGVRPFFVESARQFQPPAPAPFDAGAGSRYMALAREVYDASRNLTPQQREAAEFWYRTISPARHWMNICLQSCEQQQRSFRECLLAETALSLAVVDAFITCWDEKNRSNRARPQPAVAQLIDPNWQSLVPAPLCPEYVSELGVVSSTAAEVLTRFLGDNRAFLDQTGTPRRFLSFRQAAGEASISGLFAGVQFHDSVDAGLETGRRLGLWVIGRWPTAQ